MPPMPDTPFPACPFCPDNRAPGNRICAFGRVTRDSENAVTKARRTSVRIADDPLGIDDVHPQVPRVRSIPVTIRYERSVLGPDVLNGQNKTRRAPRWTRRRIWQAQITSGFVVNRCQPDFLLSAFSRGSPRSSPGLSRFTGFRIPQTAPDDLHDSFRSMVAAGSGRRF